MTTMPQIRKNIKFFANGKNEPLVKLAAMIQDTEEILAVLPVPEPSELNTCLQVRRDLYPLLPVDSTDVTFDQRYQQRNIMYERIDISAALRIEFAKNESGSFQIDPSTFYDDPVGLQVFIDTLNTKYGYDITTDDITITYTSGNNYTITARPNSLCFFGQASVDFGSDDETPPPIKVPSHDSVWEDATINTSFPASVNGNNVDLKNYQAMHNAGIALLQYKTPDMAWLIWTGNLQGEATLTAINDKAKVSVANVNETLTVTDENLYAKYVPFVPSSNIPPFTNPITAVNFQKTMQFMFPFAPTLDKVVGVWINDQPVSISTLLSASGAYGFKMTMNAAGEATLVHDGLVDSRVTIRVAIPTLPALVRVNSRFIYGIQRDGNNIPLDQSGREVYHIDFPAKEIIIPDPSEIISIVPDTQEDYVASLAKVASGLVLNYADYKSCNPAINFVTGGRQQLKATVESEKHEARFPAFYFIKQKDWDVIKVQPINTVLGSYTVSTSPVTNIQITVGLLLSSTVPTTNGRLLCIVGSIPAHQDGSFKLNYQPGSEYYKETTTLINLDVAYDRASLIIPRELDRTILKELSADMSDAAFDKMWTRQQADKRFINQTGNRWYINYEFKPFNMPPDPDESLDDNGQYILQLMSIPAAGMRQIQGIAARKPDAVILTCVDSGGINDTTLTAIQITQQAVIEPITGDGFLVFSHNKLNGEVGVSWTFVTDYDENDLTYRSTTTIVNITDSIIDNPVVPFNVGFQECFSVENWDVYKPIVAEEFTDNYLPWKRHNLNIASNSASGIFTKFGEETPAGKTVGRLLISATQAEWLRNGDFNQFPVTNPVIVTVESALTGEVREIKLDYMRANVDMSAGIPIPLPEFDDQQRTDTWKINVKWFGVGNPPRPAPSPLPNLIDGTITCSVKCDTKPIQKIPSLFEFTERYTPQEFTIMRESLIANGVPSTINSNVNDYEIFINSDTIVNEVATGNEEQRWTTTWAGNETEALVMQVMAIDIDIINQLKNGTFTEEELDSTVFAFASTNLNLPAFVDRRLTLRQVRERGIVGLTEGFVPVVSHIERVLPFGDPNQETQKWEADFSVLNYAGDEYGIRRVDVITRVFVHNSPKATLTLTGVTGETFPVDIQALAKAQWPAANLIPLDKLDITANNNFGLWNVVFLNKGKMGYEVVKFSEDALRLLHTANSLTPTARVFHITVDASINNFSETMSFTAAEVLAKLNAGDLFTIPLNAFIVRGNYDYTIGIRLESSVTASQANPTQFTNVTVVKDGTPPDVVVDARWTLPANDVELAAWSSSVGLQPITVNQYRMEVEQYHYTHNVEVEQSNTEYVVALKIEKSVRERLIENQYAGDTLIGRWNNADLLVEHFVNGRTDANGDNIFLVRAPINISNENGYTLSFSVSGIADYNHIFTGTDIPIVEASDVIVTKIQNNMAPVLANLRAALNPIADALVTKESLDTVITENESTIVNTINKVSRDNIGKSWVIPVGIAKEQVDILTPGSWMVVKAVGSGINITIDTDQLKQYVSEGWHYTDTDDKIYYIYPILFTFEDRVEVVAQPFDLTAGASVGRWVSWFTNYSRRVEFEYSIRQAEQSEVFVVIPDKVLFDNIKAIGNYGLEFVEPQLFNITETIAGTETRVNGMLLNKDDKKLLPIFARFKAEQVDQALDGITVASIKTSYYVRENNELVGTTKPLITLTKAQIKASPLIDGYYYYLPGFAVEGNREFYCTLQATVDYDDAEGNWLAGFHDYGIGGRPGYNVDCTGALNHAGVLDISVRSAYMISSNDVVIEVTNNAAFLNVLETTFGLKTYKVSRWTPSDGV